ncbi:hypothetical protein HDU67_006564 [Dinochytrium kinnereticum]|nr:hypothetical protein HDU67_006564 [Dinochytrium kinnereticum]
MYGGGSFGGVEMEAAHEHEERRLRMESPVLLLPRELITMIFSYLTKQSHLLNVIAVCRSFNICATPLLYKAPRFKNTFSWALFNQMLMRENNSRPFGLYVQIVDLSSYASNSSTQSCMVRVVPCLSGPSSALCLLLQEIDSVGARTQRSGPRCGAILTDGAHLPPKDLFVVSSRASSLLAGSAVSNIAALGRDQAYRKRQWMRKQQNTQRQAGSAVRGWGARIADIVGEDLGAGRGRRGRTPTHSGMVNLRSFDPAVPQPILAPSSIGPIAVSWSAPPSAPSPLSTFPAPPSKRPLNALHRDSARPKVTPFGHKVHRNLRTGSCDAYKRDVLSRASGNSSLSRPILDDEFVWRHDLLSAASVPGTVSPSQSGSRLEAEPASGVSAAVSDGPGMLDEALKNGDVPFLPNSTGSLASSSSQPLASPSRQTASLSAAAKGKMPAVFPPEEDHQASSPRTGASMLFPDSAIRNPWPSSPNRQSQRHRLELDDGFGREGKRPRGEDAELDISIGAVAIASAGVRMGDDLMERPLSASAPSPSYSSRMMMRPVDGLTGFSSDLPSSLHHQEDFLAFLEEDTIVRSTTSGAASASLRSAEGITTMHLNSGGSGVLRSERGSSGMPSTSDASRGFRRMLGPMLITNIINPNSDAFDEEVSEDDDLVRAEEILQFWSGPHHANPQTFQHPLHPPSFLNRGSSSSSSSSSSTSSSMGSSASLIQQAGGGGDAFEGPVNSIADDDFDADTLWNAENGVGGGGTGIEEPIVPGTGGVEEDHQHYHHFHHHHHHHHHHHSFVIGQFQMNAPAYQMNDAAALPHHYHHPVLSPAQMPDTLLAAQAAVFNMAGSKRPVRISVETSTLLRLSQCCPNLRTLNLAFCPLAQDYLIKETGEYLSSLLHTPPDYLTRVPVTPMQALQAVVEGCKELISLDLRGCDWVTSEVVDMVVEKATMLRALNLVRCLRLRSSAAKLFLVKDVGELRELVTEALWG